MHILRLALKTASDDESLIWSGSLFQSLGAATEKALSPYVLRFTLGSSSNLLFEDLSVRRESVLIFFILNHPCSFSVFYYPYGVFLS